MVLKRKKEVKREKRVQEIKGEGKEGASRGADEWRAQKAGNQITG
jgi:hypothetical protein